MVLGGKGRGTSASNPFVSSWEAGTGEDRSAGRDAGKKPLHEGRRMTPVVH